jgi:hypothetical protein
MKDTCFLYKTQRCRRFLKHILRLDDNYRYLEDLARRTEIIIRCADEICHRIEKYFCCIEVIIRRIVKYLRRRRYTSVLYFKTIW